MIDFRAQQHRIAVICFCAILAVAWFCYRPALSAAFQLDDAGNLGGLALIEDFRTASDYVLSGVNGPLGRPISLLTFALQADDFKDGAGAFLKVNVLIHLINAVLLAWCLYLLASLQAVERNRAILIATSAASIWLLMPLLATASLLVVQRMTTLSALFSLAGLGGYLAVRSNIANKPRGALIAMTLLLGVSTVLAAFAKESGLLLPMFVLVLEATVLVKPDNIAQRHWRAWKIGVLVLPSVIIVLYLASRSLYPEFMQVRKDFDAWQRLLTESQILWVYLKDAVFGLPGQLGIYQSEFPIARSLLEFKTFIAVLAWSGLALAAVAGRRSRPLAALAVLWYLAGHVMESTVIPLELYFEHRNYLPIVGPIFALCFYVFHLSGRRAYAGLGALSLLVLVNTYFLYVFASMWGEPSLSSRYWAHRYPDSVRATTNLATYQLLEEGPQRTLQTIRRFTAEHPEHAYLRIQELNISCLFGVESNPNPIVEEIEQALSQVAFTYTAGTMLSQLFTTTMRLDCGPIGSSTARRLAIALQQNERYVNDPFYNQFHHKLLAGIARHQGDHPATLVHLQTARSYWPTSELNMMMVTALAGSGDFTGADNFINNAMLDAPLNPLKAIAWRRNLEELRAYVRLLEKHTQTDDAEEIANGMEAGKE